MPRKGRLFVGFRKAGRLIYRYLAMPSATLEETALASPAAVGSPAPGSPGMPADATDAAGQRAFVADWVASNARETARMIGTFALVTSLVVLVIVALITGPAKQILVAGHIMMAIAMLGWYVAQRKGWRHSDLLLIVPQLILVAVYAYVLDLAAHGRGPNLMLAAACELMISMVCVRLCPIMKTRVLAVEITVCFGIGSYPMLGTPESLRWSLLLAVSLFFCLVCEHLRFRRMRGEAQLEWDARQRIRATERLAMDRQLELARQIQDSYAPPPTQLISERVTVHTYQQKYHPLGGDWVGIRELDEGRVAVIVADASGKGVQAALVTHALQSLWASASLDEGFEPITWLERVNKTLLLLGRSQLQSMTIGLAIISASEIVYYSAGHVPCFVAVATEAGRYVKALRARGNMVGVVEGLDLMPARLDLSRYSEVNVLLGSDGIFHSATQSRAPFILSTIDKLTVNDTAAVMAIDSGDDKLLIWVSRKAA